MTIVAAKTQTFRFPDVIKLIKILDGVVFLALKYWRSQATEKYKLVGLNFQF